VVKLYLVRHGIAEEGGEEKKDAERALTAEGIKKFRRAARGIVRVMGEEEMRAVVIFTSPLVRARQTAELLREAVEEAGGKADVRVSEKLVPPGDLAGFIKEARGAGRTGAVVAGVGHEPALSEWAGKICFGMAGRLMMKKGAAVGMELGERGVEGEMVVLLQPGMARRIEK
jgi:phosphohistidine phosphatase